MLSIVTGDQKIKLLSLALVTRLQATVIYEKRQQGVELTEIGGDRLLVCLNDRIAVNGSIESEKAIKATSPRGLTLSHRTIPHISGKAIAARLVRDAMELLYQLGHYYDLGD